MPYWVLEELSHDPVCIAASAVPLAAKAHVPAQHYYGVGRGNLSGLFAGMNYALVKAELTW